MTVTIRVLLAAFLIYFGFRVSIKDIEIGKISNKQIILGFKILVWAIVLLFIASVSKEIFFGLEQKTSSPFLGNIISIMNFLVDPSYTFKFYLYYLIHFGLVLACGLVFWKAKVWPAGDAKLYILFASIVPLIFSNMAQFPKKTFLVVLINIFIPAAIFFVSHLGIKMLLKILSGKHDKDIKKIPSTILSSLKPKINKNPTEISSWVFLVINYFILFSMSQVLRLYVHAYFIKILAEPMVVFGILFLVWDKIYSYMMRKRTTALFLIIMGIYLISGSFLFPERIKKDLLNGMSLVLRFGMLIMILKTFISHYFEKTQKYVIEPKDVSAGMILTRNSLARIAQDGSFYQKYFARLYSDGLSENQAEKLKNYDKIGKLEIAKSKPFGVWIWLGSIATLIMKTDILNFIKLKFPQFASLVSKIMGYG